MQEQTNAARNVWKGSMTMLMIILCYHTQAQKAKMTLADVNDIKSSTVSLVRFEAPELYVVTPKDGAGEGLIATITESDEAHDEMTAVHYYPDEALQQDLAELIAANGLAGELTVQEAAMEWVSRGELKDTQRYAEVSQDYVFEIYIEGGPTWTATFTGANWKKYWLALGAELRIYRVSDGTLLFKDYAYLTGITDSRLKFKLNELDDNGPEMIEEMYKIASKAITQKWVDKINKIKK